MRRDNTFMTNHSKRGFNPRICKRCDGNWIKDREYFNVSIHASVKDATSVSKLSAISSRVSIHASVKDATATGAKIIGYSLVSIHASVKDATHAYAPS